MAKYSNFKDLRPTYSKIYLVCSFVSLEYTIMLFLAGVNGFGYFSLAAIFFYIGLAIATYKVENLSKCFTACYFQTLIFSFIGTLVLGYSAGFGLYPLAMVPLSAYLLYMLKAKKRRVRRTLEIQIAVYAISSFLSASDIVRHVEIPTIYHKAFFFQNSIAAIVVLIVFMGVYLKRIAKEEEELKKQNDKLKKIANYDPLTKLLNRRLFETYFNNHITDFIVRKKSFSLVIFDIDDFKKVNDNYGHDVGDEVLKQVAKTIKDNVGKNEEVFRWGGEEIVLLVNGTSKEAYKIADKCRKEIKKLEFGFDKRKFKVTVTGGVAEYSEEIESSSFVDRADKALYSGKNNGKNKIVINK